MSIGKNFIFSLAMAGTLAGAIFVWSSSGAAQPAVQGSPVPPPDPNRKEIMIVQEKMKEVLKALQQNRQSAELLVQAAQAAGAEPGTVARLQQMADAFRQAFMSAVSPQQIVEAIIADQPESVPGLVITGPDGSQWALTPQDKPESGPQNMIAPPPAPKYGPFHHGRPLPPNCPAFQRMTPPNAQATPPLPCPAAPGWQERGFNGSPLGVPPAEPGETIIMEESVDDDDLPYWPTKEHLGKDGVLKYLERRNGTR